MIYGAICYSQMYIYTDICHDFCISDKVAKNAGVTERRKALGFLRAPQKISPKSVYDLTSTSSDEDDIAQLNSSVNRRLTPKRKAPLVELSSNSSQSQSGNSQPSSQSQESNNNNQTQGPPKKKSTAASCDQPERLRQLLIRLGCSQADKLAASQRANSAETESKTETNISTSTDSSPDSIFAEEQVDKRSTVLDKVSHASTKQATDKQNEIHTSDNSKSSHRQKNTVDGNQSSQGAAFRTRAGTQKGQTPGTSQATPCSQSSIESQGSTESRRSMRSHTAGKSSGQSQDSEKIPGSQNAEQSGSSSGSLVIEETPPDIAERKR